MIFWCSITTLSAKFCFIYNFWQKRGVVEGVDYGATGEVKKVDVARMRERLNGGCIVILSNLGYSSSGEVLNCKYALELQPLFYLFLSLLDLFRKVKVLFLIVLRYS